MLARLYENDMRTVYGNNLRSIATLCGTDVDELSPRMVKENVKYRIIPPYIWRIYFVLDREYKLTRVWCNIGVKQNKNHFGYAVK